MTEPIKNVGLNGVNKNTDLNQKKIAKLETKFNIWEAKYNKANDIESEDYNQRKADRFAKKLERLEAKIKNLYSPQVNIEEEPSPFDKTTFLFQQLYEITNKTH